MATKKYAAVIEIGGAVASSFKTASQAVKGDFSQIGEAVKQVKERQDMLEKFDPQAVRTAGREYRDLKRDAAKLAKAYEQAEKPTAAMRREVARAQRAAEKAGKSYKAQRERLDSLGNALRDAGVDTNKLSSEQRRLSAEMAKAESRMQALQRAADAGVGQAFGNTARSAGQLAMGVGAVATGIGAAVTMTNKLTADQENLARSLHVSSATFEAWGGLAKEAGYEADHVGDLIEEMTNKLGESKGLEEITPVKESLEILGLAFEDIINLSPEEQFLAIAKAAKELDDQQAAVSAADILMGGEANKFFGYLRSRKEGVEELLAQQRELNVLTDEGREGAVAYNSSVSKLTTVIGSATKEVSGLIGGAMAPYIEEIGPQFAAWMDEHREDIKGFAEGFGKALPQVGAFVFGMLSVIESIGSAVGWLAEMVGGFENLFWIIGGAMAVKTVGSLLMFGHAVYTAGAALAPLVGAALPALAAGIKAVGVAILTTPVGWIIGAIAAAVAVVYRLITAWDELKAAFSVGGAWGAAKTFFGFGDSGKEQDPEATTGVSEATVPKSYSTPRLPAAGGGSNTNVRQDIQVQVTAAPGQSASDVADEVMRRMDEQQNSLARGALYDGV